jgi:hypothetical protein
VLEEVGAFLVNEAIGGHGESKMGGKGIF